MQELKNSLGLEQGNINRAIERFIAELPPSSQPVARHMLAAGGKRLRPFLTLMIGRALGAPDAPLFTLGAAIEMLHAATLLHDDILDNSELRRGKPAAHTVFGPTQAILAGDALLAKSMLVVSGLGDTRLTDCISEAVMRTAEGEILEFAQLRNIDVTHDTYLEMIRGKTAWMLRASCELGALYAKAEPAVVEAARDFGMELGIAFQMVDDALDFSPTEQTGKPRGGDLKEGKITPPITFYLAEAAPEEAARIKLAIAENNLNDKETDELATAIHEGGYAAKTRKQAESHLTKAAACLERFPACSERIVLEQMLWYVQKREQ